MVKIFLLVPGTGGHRSIEMKAGGSSSIDLRLRKDELEEKGSEGSTSGLLPELELPTKVIGRSRTAGERWSQGRREKMGCTG